MHASRLQRKNQYNTNQQQTHNKTHQHNSEEIETHDQKQRRKTNSVASKIQRPSKQVAINSSQQTCKTRLAPTTTTDRPLQLCTSMTNTQDHEDTRNQQHTMTFFTMHQLDKAINSTQKRQSWRHESCTCRDDQAQKERHNRERKNTFYDCTPKSSSQALNYHGDGGT